MDEEYKPIITDEERATRRAQRAEARRKKQREKRRRLLRRLVPCGLLAVLCVGLVTVGAQLIEKPAPEMVKAERPFQVTSVASAPAPESCVCLRHSSFTPGLAILHPPSVSRYVKIFPILPDCRTWRM